MDDGPRAVEKREREIHATKSNANVILCKHEESGPDFLYSMIRWMCDRGDDDGDDDANSR